AEDGIRDFHVTGVQTCALPIWAAKAKCRTIRINNRNDRRTGAAAASIPSAFRPLGFGAPPTAAHAPPGWRGSLPRFLRAGAAFKSRELLPKPLLQWRWWPVTRIYPALQAR